MLVMYPPIAVLVLSAALALLYVTPSIDPEEQVPLTPPDTTKPVVSAYAPVPTLSAAHTDKISAAAFCLLSVIERFSE